MARKAEDDRIEAFVAGLTVGFLNSTIEYTNNAGRTCKDPTNLLLAHFFNHQTHHRGQIHDMMTQTEISPPSLDMHRIIRP